MRSSPESVAGPSSLQCSFLCSRPGLPPNFSPRRFAKTQIGCCWPAGCQGEEKYRKFNIRTQTYTHTHTHTHTHYSSPIDRRPARLFSRFLTHRKRTPGSPFSAEERIIFPGQGGGCQFSQPIFFAFLECGAKILSTRFVYET